MIDFQTMTHHFERFGANWGFGSEVGKDTDGDRNAHWRVIFAMKRFQVWLEDALFWALPDTQSDVAAVT